MVKARKTGDERENGQQRSAGTKRKEEANEVRQELHHLTIRVQRQRKKCAMKLGAANEC